MVVSMKRWEGQVAVVTGASAGIGAAICEQLVEAGLKVVGFARRFEKIQEHAKHLQGKKGKLYACKVDMTKEADIKAGFKWTTDNVGPVSILVNNAGCVTKTNLVEGNTELWKKILDTNVLGLCIATREAVQIMKKNNIDGHIVHISSTEGHNVIYFPFLNVYSASKHAVTSLTETLRQEFNAMKLKIKISSVSPGGVTTEFLQASGVDFPKEILDAMPMLKASDVADAVTYVLSTPPGVQVHDLIIKATGEQL